MGVNILEEETNPTQAAPVGRNILDTPDFKPEPVNIADQNRKAVQGRPLYETENLVQDAVVSDYDKYETLARNYYSEEEIQAIKDKGKIGIWESKNFLSYKDVLPAGGIYKGVDAAIMISAAKKIENGEELGVNEEQVLNDYLKNQIELQLRGFSIGGGVSYYGAQVPAFVTEFVATGGVGKVAQQAAVRGAGKLAEGAVAKAVIGTSANVLARSASMLPMNVANFGEVRLNDHVSLTDTGQALFKQSDESPAISALKAFGYTNAEVASELSGAAIGKYLVKPVTKYAGTVLKTPLTQAANNLPTNVKVNLYNAYKKIKPNAKFSSALSQVGFNGMLEELGEERVSSVLKESLNLAVDKDYTFDDFLKNITPTPDQLLIEAGLVGVMGGISTTGNITMNILKEKGMAEQQVNDALRYMADAEKKSLVNENISLPKSNAFLYPADTIQGSQQNIAINRDPNLIDDTESMGVALYRELVDRLDPLNRAEKKAIEAGVADSDAYTQARIYSDILGQVPQNVLVGTTVYNNQTKKFEVTGKALVPILNDFENAVMPIEANKETRIDDFKKYLIARRYLLDLQNKEDVLVTEEQINQSESDISYINDKYGDDVAYFEMFSKEVYEYQDRVLDNLVESGVMSKERKGILKSGNDNYVPFRRDLDEENQEQGDFFSDLFTDVYAGFGKGTGLFSNAAAGKVVKKIKGSKKGVKDPIESILQRTALIHDLAQRNRVALSLADLAPAIPDLVQKVPPLMEKIVDINPQTGETIEIFRPSKIAPKDTITAFRNGEKEYYKVSKPLLKAMEAMSPWEQSITVSFIEKIFQTSANIFRAGVTLRPEFALSNFFRDSMQMRVNSKKDLRPTFADIGKGMAAALGKNGSSLYNEWQRQGAPSGFYMQLDDKGLNKAMNELLSKSSYTKYAKNPIRILEDISTFFEQTNRIAAFSAAERNNIFGIHAAMISRESTIDFARGGTLTKKVGRYVPFLNASVQGVDKMWRTLINDPVPTLAWSFTAITVPSVLIAGYYLYAAPEDERREYLEIPRWQKDLFWVFKVGNHWHRVPKLQSYGFMFGSTFERFLEWGYQGDKPEMQKMWQDLALGVAGSISPVYDPTSVMPPMLKTAIESVTNYNFFTNRRIYPEWMDIYEPKFRSNAGTSETAKIAGDVINMSPAKIDNVIRGLFGGLGTYATQALDLTIKAAQKAQGKEIPQEPFSLSDAPIARGFTVREPVGYNTNSVPNLFNNWEKVSQIHASLNLLEGEQLDAYMEKNARSLELYSVLKPSVERIKDLGKISKEVYDDKFMTSEEKVDLLREYGNEMLDIAIEANKMYSETE